MKKFLFALLITITATLGACRVVPDNDGLDAQWQLMNIEQPGVPTITQTSPRLYFSFYRHTANLTGSGVITANITYSHPELTMEFPGVEWRKLSNYHLSEADGNATAPYPVVTFKVIKLTGKTLVLAIGDKTYTFRKF